MSNAFQGQRQYAQGPMGGGFGGFGGYQQPQPYSPFSGGYGTTFGGYGIGGGGYDMGYGGSPLLPPPQPTVNDLFSRYFSNQYYGGPAFNPFAATSFFGGGYGGGFGFGGGMGGGRRGRGGRMRPQPMPVQADDRMYAGGSPGFYSQPQPATIGAPPPRLSQLFAEEFSPMQFGGDRQQFAEVGPQPTMRAAVMPTPSFSPLPMGSFSLPFDQALPAKVEAPVAPAVQGVETIMPVPTQEAPVVEYTPPAPAYNPPPPVMEYIPPAPVYSLPEPVYGALPYQAPAFLDDELFTMRGLYR